MADTLPQNQNHRGLTPEGWLTDSWYFAAPSSAVKAGQQIRLMILGAPILIGRTAKGAPFALRDICPHRLVPLSAGQQIETDGEPTIACPYHGWRFGTDGVCRHMPSLIEDGAYDVSRVKVRRYPIHEAHGTLYIYIAHEPRGEKPPAVSPPDFGTLPARPKFTIARTFNADMDNAVVGLMDPAHVPFVHNQWWWRPPSAGLRVKEKPFAPRPRGWAIARHAPSSNSLAYRTLLGRGVTTEIVFQLPGFRWEIIEGRKARITTLTCLTPETTGKTRITQITWWTGAWVANLAIPLLKRWGGQFLDQDGDMVDLQNLGLAHQSNMLWIDDIDVQAKWYHTLKKEWAAACRENRAFENPLRPTLLRWRS